MLFLFWKHQGLQEIYTKTNNEYFTVKVYEYNYNSKRRADNCDCFGC